MSNRHWTDEELIHRLYGVGPDAPQREAHLDSCPECSRRWLAVERRRGELLESMQSASVDHALLRAQREAVFSRMETGPSWRRSLLWTRLVPTGATALLLAFAVILYRPVPESPARQSPPAVQQVSDEELFRDIASMVNEDAPRAAKPIQGLFDAESGIEVQ